MPARETRPVLTIGHSTRTSEQFAELLLENGVEYLVDVRRFPGSRRHPQFGEEALERRLGESGIGYLHLTGLGGRRAPRSDSPNTGWRNASFRGYADHMQTDEFGEAFGGLTELCARKRVCLMCSEAVWWRCHRRMVADALTVRGFPVEHVLGKTQRRPHELTPFASVADGQLVYPSGEPRLWEGEEGARA